MANIVQFSVDDSSPCISYFPFGDTFSTPNLTAGWNPYFVDSGFATAQGSEGNGTSLHITSFDGATVSISWQGTGIQLQGNVTNATYSITLDGLPSESDPKDLTDNVLATIYGLANTEHTLFLTAHIPEIQDPPGSSMLVFDQAIIASTPPDVTSSSTTNDIFKLQFLNDTDIAFLGRWTFESAENTSYHQSSLIGDRAMAHFSGTAFVLTGITSPQSGNYSVTLNNNTIMYSGRSSFLAYNTLLYYVTGLDPNATHTVIIENEGGGDLSLLMNGFGVYATGLPNFLPSSPIPSPVASTSLPKGTIAAFVLAGILAFFILSGLLYLMIIYRPRKKRQAARRRRQIRRSKADEAGVVLDISRRDRSPEANVVLDIGHTSHPPPRRESGKTGFARWKREVEGAVGTARDLGIDFRHSNDEKNYRRFYEGTLEAESELFSDKSSILPRRGKRRGGSKESSTKKENKNKGKSRRVSNRSWSPSNQINLPFQRPSQEDMLPQSTLGSLSYTTAPVIQGVEVSSAYHVDNLAPPSYAASVSNRNSSSTQPSFPRSVTQSSSSPHATKTHTREGSRGQLLREGEPNQGSPSDREASPESTYTPPLPVRHLSQEDRGSVRDYSNDEDPALLSGAAVRQVLRSLSPRTSKARSSPRLHKPKHVQQSVEMQTRQPSLPEPEISPEPHPIPINVPESTEKPGSEDEVVEVKDGVFLSVPEASPFKLSFDEGEWISPRNISRSVSGTSYVIHDSPPSSQGHRSSIRLSQQEFVQGTSRQPFRLTPASFQPFEHPSILPSGGVRDSFLDFTSSSNVSLRSRSNNQSDSSPDNHRYSSPPQTQHGLIEEKSRWSSTNSAPISTQEPPDNGNGSGSNNDRSTRSEPQSLPSSTFPIPFQISIPDNTQFLDPQTRSHLRISDHSIPSDQVHIHPHLESLESPTDSIPVSVSDVNFRHSDTEEPNRSQRDILSSFPSHPPLPGTPSDVDMTPTLSPPNYIVQRVLGLHSPASTTTARPPYSRSESTSAFYVTPLSSARLESSSSERYRTASESSRTTNP